MALEIITGGNSNTNVTISKGELIPIYHCIHSIHIMSYNIDLILENIALEIITGVSLQLTLRYPVMTFDPNASVHVPLTLYKFTFIKFLQTWRWKL